MTLIRNITTAAIQTPLINLDTRKAESVSTTTGNIRVIKMTNYGSNELNIKLYYEDGSANKYYIWKGTIPVGTSLDIDDLSFSSTRYKLMLDTTGSTSPQLTVIIK